MPFTSRPGAVLNQPGNIWPGSLSTGATTSLTVTASQSQAATLQKQANLVRPLTQAQTVALLKTAQLARSTPQTQGASVSALKVLIRIVSTTQAQAAVASALKIPTGAATLFARHTVSDSALFVHNVSDDT